MKKMIIAIDGHSSCGKSTLAKDLSKELSYKYLDTGAMYRAVTLFLLRNDYLNNEAFEKRLFLKDLEYIKIDFIKNDLGVAETYLDGENVEEEIRSMEVSNQVSAVSAVAEVREKLVLLQQKMGQDKGIILDGRDIGTVVFPDAEIKIFLTAQAQTRAQRRFDELTAKGVKVNLKEVEDNIIQRDFQDENREVSPLRKAEDAFLLDNSFLNREQQVEKVLEYIKEKNYSSEV